MGTDTSFIAHRAKWLRRRGLDGPVTVTWAAGALHLSGAGGGMVAIAPESIQRLYCGYTQFNGVRSYYAQLWLGDPADPLFLSYRGTGAQQRDRFGATMRALLDDLERRGLIGRVVGGLVWRKPWQLPIVVAAFSLVACSLVFWLLAGEPLWQRLVPCFIMLPVLALCVWAARAYRPPGPARSIADVEVGLPRVAG